MLDELRSYFPEFQKHHTQVEALNREFEPYFAQIHRRGREQDVGINRYSSSEANGAGKLPTCGQRGSSITDAVRSATEAVAELVPGAPISISPKGMPPAPVPTGMKRSGRPRP